jgi:hypothetical protein
MVIADEAGGELSVINATRRGSEAEGDQQVPVSVPEANRYMLRDILRAQLECARGRERQESRALQFRLTTMQLNAINVFAAINGWRVGQHHSGLYWTDHGIHFNRNRRPVAIAGQPYGYPARYIDELNAYAREHRMRWHAPPMPYASIWFPGSTLFYVMARPDVEVRWLPEQVAETGFAEHLTLEREMLREMEREQNHGS